MTDDEMKEELKKADECHFSGKEEEAFRIYAALAKQGYAPAKFALGLCYYRGSGTREDHTQSFIWFGQAARQGHPSSRFYLGYCYENGHGTAEDLAKAVELYRKAAEEGHEDAQQALIDLKKSK